jgi:hypothetical protein
VGVLDDADSTTVVVVDDAELDNMDPLRAFHFGS